MTLVGVILCAALPLAASDTEGEVCAGFTFVPYQGPSCPDVGGWRVLLADGTSVLTHGPEFAPSVVAADGFTSYPSSPPACTTTGTEHHVQAIYAHPLDKPDRSSQMKSKIRENVARANGQLRLEANILGDEMVLRFRCEANGQISIPVERLDFPHSQADYSRISSELRSRGYNAGNAKYIVFYDANNGGGIGNGIAGQGAVHFDDRLIADNANLAGSDYAINYGFTDTFGAEVTLHELGHTLGAVQLNAPYTSGGWHCNDGLDTMCYGDGGANASYDSGRCSDRKHWDCGHDTYFHPAPPAASYLSTHWNVASRYNKYLAFGERENTPPAVVSVACDKATTLPQANATCTAWAYDPDDDPAFSATPGRLNITLDWGDGTATGPLMIESGRSVIAKHAWSATGEYTITVVATDSAAPPLASPAQTLAHKVGCAYRGTGSNLLVGALGVPLREPVSSRDHEVPEACIGAPYTLSGNAPNDFDVCWFDAGGALLECNTGFGAESGTVPAAAATARVILTFGANGVYSLVLG